MKNFLFLSLLALSLSGCGKSVYDVHYPTPPSENSKTPNASRQQPLSASPVRATDATLPVEQNEIITFETQDDEVLQPQTEPQEQETDVEVKTEIIVQDEPEEEEELQEESPATAEQPNEAQEKSVAETQEAPQAKEPSLLSEIPELANVQFKPIDLNAALNEMKKSDQVFLKLPKNTQLQKLGEYAPSRNKKFLAMHESRLRQEIAELEKQRVQGFPQYDWEKAALKQLWELKVQSLRAVVSLQKQGTPARFLKSGGILAQAAISTNTSQALIQSFEEFCIASTANQFLKDSQRNASSKKEFETFLQELTLEQEDWIATFEKKTAEERIAYLVKEFELSPAEAANKIDESSFAKLIQNKVLTRINLNKIPLIKTRAQACIAKNRQDQLKELKSLQKKKPLLAVKSKKSNWSSYEKFFFQESGLKPILENDKETADLSELFSEQPFLLPESFTSKNIPASIAVTVTEDMEATWYQKNPGAPISLSKWYTFMALSQPERQKEKGLAACKDAKPSESLLQTMAEKYFLGIRSAFDSFNALIQNNNFACSIQGDDQNMAFKIPNDKAVTGFDFINNSNLKSVSFEFFKALLDQGQAPQVQITTDYRQILENWIQPAPEKKGLIQPMFLVVGYGLKGLDPFDLTEKPYLVIRDSSAPHPIHYRVDAQVLLKSIFGVFKILDIEAVPVQ